MALINYEDKVDLTTKNVPEANKITASNMNELKVGVNTNEVNIEALQGASEIYVVSSNAEILAK